MTESLFCVVNQGEVPRGHRHATISSTLCAWSSICCARHVLCSRNAWCAREVAALQALGTTRASREQFHSVHTLCAVASEGVLDDVWTQSRGGGPW